MHLSVKLQESSPESGRKTDHMDRLLLNRVYLTINTLYIDSNHQEIECNRVLVYYIQDIRALAEGRAMGEKILRCSILDTPLSHFL